MDVFFEQQPSVLLLDDTFDRLDITFAPRDEFGAPNTNRSVVERRVTHRGSETIDFAGTPRSHYLFEASTGTLATANHTIVAADDCTVLLCDGSVAGRFTVSVSTESESMLRRSYIEIGNMTIGGFVGPKKVRVGVFYFHNNEFKHMTNPGFSLSAVDYEDVTVNLTQNSIYSRDDAGISFKESTFLRNTHEFHLNTVSGRDAFFYSGNAVDRQMYVLFDRNRCTATRYSLFMGDPMLRIIHPQTEVHTGGSIDVRFNNEAGDPPFWLYRSQLSDATLRFGTEGNGGARFYSQWSNFTGIDFRTDSNAPPAENVTIQIKDARIGAISLTDGSYTNSSITVTRTNFTETSTATVNNLQSKNNVHMFRNNFECTLLTFCHNTFTERNGKSTATNLHNMFWSGNVYSRGTFIDICDSNFTSAHLNGIYFDTTEKFDETNTIRVANNWLHLNRSSTVIYYSLYMHSPDATLQYEQNTHRAGHLSLILTRARELVFDNSRADGITIVHESDANCETRIANSFIGFFNVKFNGCKYPVLDIYQPWRNHRRLHARLWHVDTFDLQDSKWIGRSWACSRSRRGHGKHQHRPWELYVWWLHD